MGCKGAKPSKLMDSVAECERPDSHRNELAVTVRALVSDIVYGYSIPDRTNYPLLFDRDRKAKAAFGAVVSVPK